MALQRRNGRSYYYRKQRNGSRVTSQYVGSGDLAELAALVDQQAQAEREQERAILKEARQQAQSLDRAILPALDAVGPLLAALLPLAGYYQHRGQWRKYAMTVATPPTAKELHTLFERCDANDQAALVEVRKIFRDFPERCRHVTNGLAQVTTQLISSVQTTPLTRETMTAGVAQLRVDLGHADAPALERLLIDAVAVAWLRLTLIEQTYTNTLNREHTLTLALFWERRLSAAQGRYLRAVESLARVRRLAVPALIQNIAAHQTVQIGA